jgi:hypothetical protein
VVKDPHVEVLYYEFTSLDRGHDFSHATAWQGNLGGFDVTSQMGGWRPAPGTVRERAERFSASWLNSRQRTIPTSGGKSKGQWCDCIRPSMDGFWPSYRGSRPSDRDRCRFQPASAHDG